MLALLWSSVISVRVHLIKKSMDKISQTYATYGKRTGRFPYNIDAKLKLKLTVKKGHTEQTALPLLWQRNTIESEKSEFHHFFLSLINLSFASNLMHTFYLNEQAFGNQFELLTTFALQMWAPIVQSMTENIRQLCTLCEALAFFKCRKWLVMTSVYSSILLFVHLHECSSMGHQK